MALIDGDDLGRKLVDRNLEDLETKIERIYSDACEDMQKKLDRFLDRFEAQDAQMHERLSEEEYQHWREIQILQSDRMRIQIEALSRDAVNADRLAAEMINNDMPYVYSTSYNFATFRGEMMAEYANVPMPAVPMMNMEAFRILATEDPTLLPVNIDIEEDLRWNQQHITSAITQGIVQGESIPNISRRLRQVTDMDARAARRNARTACTYIENRGRREGVQKLRDAGIPFDEPWNATIDDRTRETHVLLHGTLPNEDGYYGEGILDIRHKPLMREPADPDGALDEIYNCRCCVKAWLHGIDHSDFEDRYARFMTEEHFEDWQRLGEERERNGYAEQEQRFEDRRQTAQARNEEIRQQYLAEQKPIDPAENNSTPNDTAQMMEDPRSTMEARAREISGMTDAQIYGEFISPDSYIYTDPEYLANNNDEEYAEWRDLRQEISSLNEELKGEWTRKPREQWTEEDEFMALLGERPKIYTERGEEILARLNQIRPQEEQLERLLDERREIRERISREQAREQIARWNDTSHPFVHADISDHFTGFSTTMRSAYDEDLANGIGFIAEMSPQEYLQRCAYDIFETSYEHALVVEFGNVQQYAQMMADGVQFDMGYLNYDIHGTGRFGQEGRHRAMAAYLLGIKKIPVYIRGR